MELAKTDEHAHGHLDKSHNTNLAAMADLALIVNDTVLPAHSYVLAASSPALGQLLSDKLAEHEGLEDNDKRPVLLDLSDNDLACVQAALRFLYSVCPYHGEQPKVDSAEEAEHIATFGRKYGVTLMSTVSDNYLHDLLIRSHNPIVGYRSVSPFEAKQVKEQLPEILKWTSFAEAKDLPKTLQHCEGWLAH